MRFIIGIAAFTAIGIWACGEHRHKPKQVHTVEQEPSDEAINLEEVVEDSPSPNNSNKGLEKFERTTGFPTFLEYCKNENLSADTERTINVLLELVNSTDCDEANRRLLERSSMILPGKDLTDLKPLASFPKLQKLSLRNNKIRDISPLADLNELQYLVISWNQIEDLAPLSKLENLRFLLMSNNPLLNVEPIKHIQSLEYVWHGSGEPVVERVTEKTSEEAKQASEKKLTWKDGEGVCSGGWLYRPYKTCRHESHGIESYKSTRSKACGIEKTNKNPKSCRHESNGVEKWKTSTEKETFQILGNERTVREKLRVRSGISWIDKWVDKVVIDPIPDLPHRADDLVKKCVKWSKRFKEPNAHISIEHKFLHREPLRLELECEVEVKKADIYKKAANLACGFTEEKIFKSCEHPSHGVEFFKQMPSPVCGTESKTQRSSRKTHRFDIEKQHGNIISCTTCDDIFTETSEDRAKKITCYKVAIDSKDEFAIKEARQGLSDLFFAKTEQLSESQAEFIQESIFR